jgi:hypothetical protein
MSAKPLRGFARRSASMSACASATHIVRSSSLATAQSSRPISQVTAVRPSQAAQFFCKGTNGRWRDVLTYEHT